MINLKPDITAPVITRESDSARSSSSNSSSVDNSITGTEEPNQLLAQQEQLRSEALKQDEKAQKEAEAKREEALEEKVTDLNSNIQGIQRNLAFSIDKDLGEIIVNVTDKKTDEIIRQIPSEEFLDLARNLQDMLNSKANAQQATISSAFLDTKA